MSGTVRAVGLQLNYAGRIPAVNICITFMIIPHSQNAKQVCTKWQHPMCHHVPQRMNNIGGLPSSATHPPTQKR